MDKILEIKDLTIHYLMDYGVVEAVNNVSLSMETGEVLGLVGETGAGKTTLAKGIMRLIPHPPGKIVNGSILYNGTNLLDLPENEMRHIRGKEISMIFQDPMTSLNPVMTVGDQIAEVVQNHRKLSKKDAREYAKKMLEMVGIPADRSEEYPHQFSGGMKQRVVIAIALACSPQLLIADEPTTALDVTIQAQVLQLMQELKAKINTSMVLITHDLGVIAQNCDRVAVMYAGVILEYGTVLDIFANKLHPYTQGLFGAIPKINCIEDRLQNIPGMMPDPTQLPKGCKFHDRCQFATERCGLEEPPMVTMGEGHQVKCFLYQP